MIPLLITVPAVCHIMKRADTHGSFVDLALIPSTALALVAVVRRKPDRDSDNVTKLPHCITPYRRQKKKQKEKN
jgi:hypothetical protein